MLLATNGQSACLITTYLQVTSCNANILQGYEIDEL